MDIELSARDREFMDMLRGISIFRVVLAHLGLTWFYPPYSTYIGVFLPVLFFVSGAVSYLSYCRYGSIVTYYVKRISSVAVPYYLIVLVVFFYIFVLNEFNYQVGVFNLIFNWLTFNPMAVQSTMPFPLGQVWFIHSLIIMAIFSPAIFFMINNKKSALFFFVILIFVISVVQCFYNFSSLLYIAGHNFYQPLSNSLFFIFGSFYIKYREYLTRKSLLVSTLFFILISYLFFRITGISVDIRDHSYSPDFYYISCSFAAILFMLYMKEFLLCVFKYLTLLKKFFLFMSKNSYSVYILHSFVVFFLEKYFGLVDVSDSIAKIIVKILLTLVITSFLSLPFTMMANSITSLIRSKMFYLSNISRNIYKSGC